MTNTKEPQEDAPKPPAGLSDRSLALWQSCVPARAISPARPIVIEDALRALDRADEARLVIETEGMVSQTETTGALHVHPLVKVQRENRALFACLWDQLGFFFHHKVDPVESTW